MDRAKKMSALARILMAESDTSWGGAQSREPTPSERAFFERSGVPGYAAPDNRIVMNPAKPYNPHVAANEAARIFMRQPGWQPDFDLTPEQRGAFSQYSPLPDDQRATVAARLYSGDPSALDPTEQQAAFVRRLRRSMIKNESE